jgi:hypothetical protein
VDRARPVVVVAVAATLSALILAGGAVIVARHGGHDRARTGHAPGASASPSASGPAASAGPVIVSTGRGRGFFRVIPCYLLTSHQVGRVLHTDVGIAQRAAGSGGDELRGFAREDCYWFSTATNGPYAVVSDVTTLALRSRGLTGWTARRYFLTRHRRHRTYLHGIGDAAYTFGPASVAVLVGDVYVDVTVVAHDGHPLRDAISLARLLGRLDIHGP